MLRKALVTGGAGLLGSRLVRALLERGTSVRVLDTRYGELDGIKTERNLEFVGVGSNELSGGVASESVVEDAVKGVDVVYHLAINWDGASWRHLLPLANLFDVNIRGTLNLLNSAEEKRIRHFLFSSSAAVYGETERTRLKHRVENVPRVDEESVCRPELWDGDPGPGYAILKLTLERLCLMYHHHYGLPVTAFRIEYIFSNKREIDDGANIHVEDVVQAFLLSTLNKKAYGQVINIADTPYMSTSKAERLLGWKPRRTREFLSKLTQKQSTISDES